MSKEKAKRSLGLVTEPVANETEEVPQEPAIEAATPEAEFDPDKFVLGDRKFTIRPMSERDEEFAYEDQADFFIAALPVLIKVMELLNSISEASTFGSLNTYDILQLAKEFRDGLPQMCAIVCWNDDRDVTEVEVKRLAKSPLNPQMIRAVLRQIEIDGIWEQVISVQKQFATVSTAAAN